MKKSFAVQIKNLIDDKFLEALECFKELSEKRKIANDTNQYGENARKEATAAVWELETRLGYIMERGTGEITALCNQIAEEILLKDESLKGDELVSDCKLLDGNYPLTVNDARSILARNPGNNTVARLVSNYADKAGWFHDDQNRDLFFIPVAQTEARHVKYIAKDAQYLFSEKYLESEYHRNMMKDAVFAAIDKLVTSDE